jgi:hypothetical protein
MPVQGVRAGVLAAAVWAMSEPFLGRAFAIPYSDVRLLGRVITRGRRWPIAGLALHLANGAAFGAAFERLGLNGTREGIAAAEAENLLLWPAMILVDRFHPDRRDGLWPPLAGNWRVIAYEATTHALFGAVVGAGVSRAETGPYAND